MRCTSARLDYLGLDYFESERTTVGNNIEAIIAGMTEAKSKTGKGKPVCILLHTEMGNGVDYMMYSHAWHGKAPNDAQLENALAQNYTESESDY